MRISIPFILAMLCAVVSGCSQKWEEHGFPDYGFTATFPMPVSYQGGDKGSKIFQASAGKTKLRIIHFKIPAEEIRSRSASELVAEIYADTRDPQEKSPRGVVIRGGQPALESSYALTMSDGSTWETKRQLMVAADNAYVVQAVWPSGDKDGPGHADRFMSSFQLGR